MSDKTFSQFDLELTEDYRLKNMLGGLNQGSQAVDDGNSNHFMLNAKKELRRLNAFIGGIARGEYIDPDSVLSNIRTKLFVVGMVFDPATIGDQDEGQLFLPLRQYEGIQDMGDGTIEDVNVLDKAYPSGLYLHVNWYLNEFGMTKITAKCITGDEIDEMAEYDEDLAAALEEQLALSESDDEDDMEDDEDDSDDNEEMNEAYSKYDGGMRQASADFGVSVAKIKKMKMPVVVTSNGLGELEDFGDFDNAKKEKEYAQHIMKNGGKVELVEEKITEAQKMKQGDKFIKSINYNNKKITLARRGDKMSSPIVAFVNEKELGEYKGEKLAMKKAQDYIDGINEGMKSFTAFTEVNEKKETMTVRELMKDVKYFEKQMKSAVSPKEKADFKKKMEAAKKEIDMLSEEQKTGGDKAYQAFLAKKLKSKGYDSIKDIPDDKKDDFFNEVEGEWESDDEREMNEALSSSERKKLETELRKARQNEDEKKIKEIKAKLGHEKDVGQNKKGGKFFTEARKPEHEHVIDILKSKKITKPTQKDILAAMNEYYKSLGFSRLRVGAMMSSDDNVMDIVTAVNQTMKGK